MPARATPTRRQCRAERDDEVRQEWRNLHDDRTTVIVETLRAGAVEGAFNVRDCQELIA